MVGPATSCPNCGGPVEFRWADAVQTVCTYCSSVLVRHDVALERVGVVSAPPSANSRIQLGTRGSFRGTAFTVVGRLAYEWDRGAWNEWHLLTADGGSAWLAEADGEYSVTVRVKPEVDPTPAQSVEVGEAFEWGGARYQVTEVVWARYTGTEGELPFEYHDKTEVLFADLRTEDGRAATIDYSETPPLVFAGWYATWDALQLTELRELAAPTVAGDARAAMQCPACGGPVQVRAAGHSVTVACGQCGSVLDAADPELRVLQQVQERMRVEPRIPLGSRGRLHGVEWEVIGFQARQMMEEGIAYPWREYVLFNPERGFRYLTEENGHWNDAVPLTVLPTESTSGGRPVASVHGQTFKHFETCSAATTFVLGEFPWQVRIGDTELARDYVDPPRLLSAESTAGETAWTLSEYTSPHTIWKAFALPGAPPVPHGVYANQPSPHRGKAGRMGRTFLLLAALFVGFFVFRNATAAKQEVGRGSFDYSTFASDKLEDPEIGPFTLAGNRPASLRVDVSTDLDNSWAAFDFQLVEMDSGRVVSWTREAEYYYGQDSEGSWTEGSRSDGARIPAVPPGRYTLRIDPESEGRFHYSVVVRHDVPSTSFFVIALILLAVPFALSAIVSGSFEGQRWAESDYAPEDDDDD
jgi:hypothetical protein